MKIRHPFTQEELNTLIADSGLMASNEPRAKDEFVRRINALQKMQKALMEALGDLTADLYRGPYPDTASAPEALGHADQ